MHSLAARVMHQAAVAGQLAAVRHRAGGTSGRALARGFVHRQHQRSQAAPATAIATPFRIGTEPAVAPAPAPALPVLVPPALTRGLAAAWQGYLRSLDRRPLLTKAATSFACVLIGDSLAQLIGGAPYSVGRVLRLAAYSSTVGASVGHHWHRWLEQHVHPEAPASSHAVAKKTLLDQLVMSPAMLLLFFTAVKLMEGRPEAILPYVQDKYVSTLLAGYAVWFPWNIASFKWIPQDLRILAGNLMGIGWGCYISLSCINSAPAPVCPAAISAVVAVAVAQAAATARG